MSSRKMRVLRIEVRRCRELVDWVSLLISREAGSEEARGANASSQAKWNDSFKATAREMRSMPAVWERSGGEGISDFRFKISD